MKPTRKSIEEFAESLELDIVFADGFDKCIIGLGQCFDSYKVIYDRSKVIASLMEHMTQEDAEEFFEYNVVGSYIGESTPIFTVDLGFN